MTKKLTKRNRMNLLLIPIANTIVFMFLYIQNPFCRMLVCNIALVFQNSFPVLKDKFINPEHNPQGTALTTKNNISHTMKPKSVYTVHK